MEPILWLESLLRVFADPVSFSLFPGLPIRYSSLILQMWTAWAEIRKWPDYAWNNAVDRHALGKQALADLDLEFCKQRGYGWIFCTPRSLSRAPDFAL